MVTPYRTKKLKAATFMQKALGREPRENGFIRINNLLAQHSQVQQVRPEDIYALIEQYALLPGRSHDKVHFLRMYAQLLRAAFTHKPIHDDCIAELRAFKRLFDLSDRDLFRVMRATLQTHFGQDYEKLFLEKSGLTPEERDLLRKIQSQLILPDAILTSIYSEKPEQLLAQLLKGASTHTATLNDHQRKELKALANTLGISAEDFNIEHKTPQQQLNMLYKLRVYWCVQNERIPQLSLPAALADRDEQCFLSLPVQWSVRRQPVRYAHYGEPSLWSKVLQGIYWRKALPVEKMLAHEVWNREDKGDLFLTNQRLFFVGEQGNRQLPFSKVSNFQAYANGLDVQRTNGEGVFFLLPAHVDLLAMLLGKALMKV